MGSDFFRQKDTLATSMPFNGINFNCGSYYVEGYTTIISPPGKDGGVENCTLTELVVTFIILLNLELTQNISL